MNPFSKRRHKYGVTSLPAARTLDGVVYDSKAEMRYAYELSLLLRGGAIAKVERQIKFVFASGVGYVADFRCTENDGRAYYVDVKGMETPEFRIKCRLWRSEGPGPLHIVKLMRGRFVVDRTIIPGQPLPRKARTKRAA